MCSLRCDVVLSRTRLYNATKSAKTTTTIPGRKQPGDGSKIPRVLILIAIGTHGAGPTNLTVCAYTIRYPSFDGMPTAKYPRKDSNLRFSTISRRESSLPSACPQRLAACMAGGSYVEPKPILRNNTSILLQGKRFVKY